MWQDAPVRNNLWSSSRVRGCNSHVHGGGKPVLVTKGWALVTRQCWGRFQCNAFFFSIYLLFPSQLSSSLHLAFSQWDACCETQNKKESLEFIHRRPLGWWWCTIFVYRNVNDTKRKVESRCSFTYNIFFCLPVSLFLFSLSVCHSPLLFFSSLCLHWCVWIRA